MLNARFVVVLLARLTVNLLHPCSVIICNYVCNLPITVFQKPSL